MLPHTVDYCYRTLCQFCTWRLRQLFSTCLTPVHFMKWMFFVDMQCLRHDLYSVYLNDVSHCMRSICFVALTFYFIFVSVRYFGRIRTRDASWNSLYSRNLPTRYIREKKDVQHSSAGRYVTREIIFFTVLSDLPYSWVEHRQNMVLPC